MDGVPLIALVVFAAAFAAGIAMFSCLYLLTRRLGLTFERRFGGASLSTEDGKRLFKTLWSGQDTLIAANVTGLVWSVRLLYVAVVALVGAFILIVVGASS